MYCMSGVACRLASLALTSNVLFCKISSWLGNQYIVKFVFAVFIISDIFYAIGLSF